MLPGGLMRSAIVKADSSSYGWKKWAEKTQDLFSLGTQLFFFHYSPVSNSYVPDHLLVLLEWKDSQLESLQFADEPSNLSIQRPHTVLLPLLSCWASMPTKSSLPGQKTSSACPKIWEFCNLRLTVLFDCCEQCMTDVCNINGMHRIKSLTIEKRRRKNE